MEVTARVSELRDYDVLKYSSLLKCAGVNMETLQEIMMKRPDMFILAYAYHELAGCAVILPITREKYDSVLFDEDVSPIKPKDIGDYGKMGHLLLCNVFVPLQYQNGEVIKALTNTLREFLRAKCKCGQFTDVVSVSTSLAGMKLLDNMYFRKIKYCSVYDYVVYRLAYTNLYRFLC